MDLNGHDTYVIFVFLFVNLNMLNRQGDVQMYLSSYMLQNYKPIKKSYL